MVLSTASLAEMYEDVEACAAAAGLVYASWEGPGLRRQRRGRGFCYLDATGAVVTDATVKARIAALAIPPAWTDVWISAREDAHLLAVGHDDRGRRQYLYHERWRAIRDELNFHRLVLVGESLPPVREFVETQLRRRTLDRDRALATMIRIVDKSAVRIGNVVYAEENESFGLTTLAKRHVKVDGDTIRMKFPAKSNKQADLTVVDRPAARVVAELLRRRTPRLFTVDRAPIEGNEVNARLGQLSATHITAKDFRTWNGTLAAFRYLEDHLDAADDPEKTVIGAVDAAAEVLGDTRAVARAHYVHPQVLSSFVDGTLAEWSRPAGRERHLDGSERRLLALLRSALAHDTALA